jgi:uroporphyrinogen decarboxylase
MRLNWFESLIIPRDDCILVMNKFELLKETLRGELSEQLPIALWKHHPETDRNPATLADSEIEFHRHFDSDLLKISFFGHYPCVDFGCKVVYDGANTGSTTLIEAAINEVSDWEVMEPPDVNSGEFGNQIRAVELIQKYAHGVVPTLATVFDPTMVADKICGKRFTEYIDTHPDIMHSALDLITDVMVDFAQATIDAGAYGLFLASQHSTHSSVTDAQYKEFVYPYDLKLISKLRGKGNLMVMHLHAREDDEKIRFDKISRTPGLDAINWEDQTSSHSLKEGRRICKKTVLGGIDHNGIFRTGSPEEASKQVKDAIEEAGYEKLIVAPGCVVTVDTPIENIQAVVDLVRSIDLFKGR